jgi:polysaccharide deacetylase family protein (PEP-CTERM system associated)
MATSATTEILNAFCVDLEEWFHLFGSVGPYADPKRWDDAPSTVVHDTEILMRMLDKAGVRGTFLTVGWVAERHPELIRRLVREGHEIGCHTYWHRLVYETGPEEFEADLVRSLEVLRDLSGQPVDTFRAPAFSIRGTETWAFEILARHGIKTDLSIVPARGDHGGMPGASRDHGIVSTPAGDLRCLVNPVMDFCGTTLPFAGGGYLRLFPQWLIDYGFEQNHAAGRACVTYIHPREVNPDHPRVPKPPLARVKDRLKYHKYYVNLRTTQPKLERLLRRYRFGTVGQMSPGIGPWQPWPSAAVPQTSVMGGRL